MNETVVELNDITVLSPKGLYSLMEERSLPKLTELFKDNNSLLSSLGTNADTGLTQDSYEANLKKYGTNVMPPARTKSFFRFLYEAFSERMVRLLVIAAAITVGVGIYQTATGEANAWIEGIAILIAISVITGVNSVNDWRKQARFKKLSDVTRELQTVKIVRNSQTLQVPLKELTVGDILYVSMGDVVPCDGILISGKYVRTDESSLTGESDQLLKQVFGSLESGDPFIISGTLIVDGKGTMVITGVGEYSIQGMMMKDLRIDPPPTPLQIKLGNLAKKLATAGLIGAIITCVILFVIYFVKGSPGNIFNAIVNIILIGIAILVMAIPEGLPLAVTLALAYATIHMLKDNNLVRHLNACETMGGATTICSDKTGTLTMNKMQVVEALILGKRFHREDLDLLHTDENGCGGIGFDEFHKDSLQNIADNVMVNSEAYEAVVRERKKFIGSNTDVALLTMFQKMGYDYVARRKTGSIVEQIPFSSERKRMTTVEELKNSVIRTYVKGASEIILQMCSFEELPDGRIRPLTRQRISEIEDLISDYAGKSLRTIILAYREGNHANEEAGFILCALFGIEDPLRSTARDSVKQCQGAGIVVRMVTGDNPVTARSIATQCGILDANGDEGHLVIEGHKFRNLSDEERISAAKNLRVMARASPGDKLLLVQTLKSMGEIVAVTGDGANDGPALKSSHIGFSMGVTGTEIAKEASDIVLLDDNFASLVRAVAWGRAIYQGIQRFITFQLSVNISAVTITFITAIYSGILNGIPLAALTTLQILMINLIADTLAALALSTDKPTADLLKKKPTRADDRIITRNMRYMVAAESTYQTIVGLAIYFVGPYVIPALTDLTLRGTLVFNTFVYMVLFNELNCRSVTKDYNIFRGISKNKFFLPLFIVGFIIQFPVVTWLGIIFTTVPLAWYYWVFSIVVGTGSIVVGILTRMFLFDDSDAVGFLHDS